MLIQKHPCLSIVLLACALLLTSAHSAGAQAAGLDPALLAKATAGDAAAEVQVGEAYARAAANEQDRAQIAEDWKQAVEWYRKAADQNNVSGELRLAALYRDGAGKYLPRDMTQAATWYRKAADQGDAAAQGTLGMLYTLGQGVPRNDVEAYFWLDLAAQAPGPSQQQYAANRQNVGTRITADELSDIQDREAQWKAAHPSRKE